MNRILTLIKGDVKNIKRDIILCAAVFAPVLLSVFLRFTVPVATSILHIKLGFDLTEFYPLIIGIALMLAPMLIGCMTGFVLLEDKDEKMLMYYSITPLKREGYLLYRITMPVFLNIILSFFLAYFTNLIAISFIRLLAVIIMASLEAIIVSFFLGTYGENRVDGLALSKALGVFYIVPVIDKLLNFKYDFLLGVFPTYWIPKIVEASGDIFNLIILLILGFAVHGIYIYFLCRKFTVKV